MERVNSALEQRLRDLEYWDGVLSFWGVMQNNTSPNDLQVLERDLRELEGHGLLSVEETEYEGLVFHLTSRGRTYFSDLDAAERRRRAEREEDRAYARRTAIIGASIGVGGSLLINLPSIISLLSR